MFLIHFVPSGYMQRRMTDVPFTNTANRPVGYSELLYLPCRDDDVVSSGREPYVPVFVHGGPVTREVIVPSVAVVCGVGIIDITLKFRVCPCSRFTGN